MKRPALSSAGPSKRPKKTKSEIKLLCCPHDSIELPFDFDPEDFPITISTDATIGDLMEYVEELFEELGEGDEGETGELFQVGVLWSMKTPKKNLNPSDTISKYFEGGDSFGVHGEFLEQDEPEEKLLESEKLPVTILTGFLGSGKTTLLNYILQEQKDKKIAVIENEFGEVSIDDALLKKDKMALAEKVVLMDNGCICCTIRGDLEKGLMSILDEVRKGSRIDVIIIETTGMADPVPIVRTFMTNPLLTRELRLDGLISLADAKHIEARLDDKVEEGKVNEAYQQIAFADKIILNKLDLVSPEELIKCKERIRSINKFAKILPAVKGRVKLAELSNIHAHDISMFGKIELDKEAEVAPELGARGHGDSQSSTHGGHGGHGGHEDGHGGAHGDDCSEDRGHGGHGGGDGHGGHGGGHSASAGHGTGHGHGSSASRHDSRVNSMSIVREGEIEPQKLNAWMATLSEPSERLGTLFRMKAILAVKGHPFKRVFHAVMDVCDQDDADRWAEGEKRVNKIVFIGKSLNEKALRDGFEAVFD